MASLQFSGKFEGGLGYEIHCMSTFSGRQEMAIVIEGKPAVIISVTKKRNGAIEIVPVLTQKTHIAAEGPAKEKELKESAPVKPNRIKED